MPYHHQPTEGQQDERGGLGNRGQLDLAGRVKRRHVPAAADQVKLTVQCAPIEDVEGIELRREKASHEHDFQFSAQGERPGDDEGVVIVAAAQAAVLLPPTYRLPVLVNRVAFVDVPSPTVTVPSAMPLSA